MHERSIAQGDRWPITSMSMVALKFGFTVGVEVNASVMNPLGYVRVSARAVWCADT
jgi:hypothetical protein